MTLKNVSSPFVVAGSDTDLELWMPSWLWAFCAALLATLGIGYLKRDRTYRVELGPLTELFLVDSEQPDAITLALASNLSIMRSWDTAKRASYMEWKQQLSDLSGTERKQAKAAVARLFGLDASVYGG